MKGELHPTTQEPFVGRVFWQMDDNVNCIELFSGVTTSSYSIVYNMHVLRLEDSMTLLWRGGGNSFVACLSHLTTHPFRDGAAGEGGSLASRSRGR